LAQQVATTQSTRSSAATVAEDGWLGTFKDEFVKNMQVANTDSAGVKTALETAARGIAESWAMANQQQQTYIYYDNVRKARDHVSGWDKFWGDDTDYGKPPNPPAVPTPPSFEPTKVPQAFVPH
jgi:hypothetical protein